LFLVLRRTPATVDLEFDAVACGIRCGPTQGTEQIGVEVGHGRKLVIEDRDAVGDDAICLVDDAIGLATCAGAIYLAGCTMAVAVRNVGG
jgi:hypothetical protein